MHSLPASASPRPRTEQWWFDAWEIRDKVWPLTQGQGVIVALIDSGVEAGLPDLEGAVLPGTEYHGSFRSDGRRDTDTALGGHGTAMAALIAGQGKGTGMMGIAPQSRILPIGGDFSDAAEIPYAVDHGAKVINISVGTPAAHCTDESEKAVAYALNHDVVVVAAAGNDGSNANSLVSPANCPGVLTVGAVDSELSAWKKTTPGDNVMLAAPGVSVGSIGKDGTFSSSNNGTSQAAALTSAVVALVRSRFPKMPAREVVQRVLATAKDIAPAGRDQRTGYGALIPYLALTANVPANAPNPVYEHLAPGRSKGAGNPASSKSELVQTGAGHRSEVSWKSNILLWSVSAIIVFVLAVVIAGYMRRSTSGERSR